MVTVDDGRAQRQSGSALITIIGGAGFIGRRLVAQLLHRGHNVRVVDVVAPGASGLDYREADVRDVTTLAAAVEGSSVVYNLAAVHRDDIRPLSLYHDVNVRGATNVANVCRDLGIDKLVFSSSVAVYGAIATNASEDTSPRPSNEYGRSKLQAEHEYRKWQSEVPNRRSLVIIRPSVVFGEGNRGNIYRLLQQIATRRFVMVGSGNNRKSMAHVDNLSAFLVHVIGLGAGIHLFNYTDKPDLSMEELVEIILHALGRPSTIRSRVPYIVGYLGGSACDLLACTIRKNLPISAARIRKFCSTTTYGTHRVQSTGFKPLIDLHDALRNTIRHELSA